MHAENTAKRPYTSLSSLDMLYVDAANKHIPLSREQEKDYCARIQGGDIEARNDFVEKNMLFAIKIAKRYENRGVPLEDLIIAGSTGLVTAAHKFDASRGNKYISYAVWYIRQAILEEISLQGRPVRIPLNRSGDFYRINKRIEYFMTTEHRSETEAIELVISEMERAQETRSKTGKLSSKISPREALQIARNTANPVRLDHPIQDGEGGTHGERLAGNYESPDERVERYSGNLRWEAALNTLKERERKVVVLYNGLEGHEEHTLEDIATLIGVTRERVRQIKEKAYKALRNTYQQLPPNRELIPSVMEARRRRAQQHGESLEDRLRSA